MPDTTAAVGIVQLHDTYLVSRTAVEVVVRGEHTVVAVLDHAGEVLVRGTDECLQTRLDVRSRVDDYTCAFGDRDTLIFRVVVEVQRAARHVQPGDGVRSAITNMNGNHSCSSIDSEHWEEVDDWACVAAGDSHDLRTMDLASDLPVWLSGRCSCKANQELIHNAA